MFLESMTADDLSRIYKNEIEFVVKNFKRFSLDINKAAKVRRPFPLYFYRSFKSPGKNEYLLIGATSDGKEFTYQILAVMASINGAKLYSIIDNDAGDMKERFTTHFVKRYMERSLKKNVAPELALAMFFHRNHGPALIFKKEIKPGYYDSVFAITDGVTLANSDLKVGISTYNTFISDDLLGTSQRIAKQRMLEVIPKDNSNTDIFSFVKAGELSEEAQSIYESFFTEDSTDYLVLKKQNEDNDLRLNFKLKTSEEKRRNNDFRKNEVTPSKVYIPVNENFTYHGTITNSEGIKPTGVGTIHINHDSTYQGEVKEGLPHGKGTLKTPDATYTGMFKDGNIYGMGKKTTSAGTMEGFFDDEDIIGKGKFVFSSGSIYEGEFKDGLPHGEGILKKLDGTVLDGTFRKGNFVKGKLTMSDGSFIIGKFKNGQIDGTCKLGIEGGEVRFAKYRNGELILMGGIVKE